VSGMLGLRDYQQEAIEDFCVRVITGDTRIPSVLATGLGKTVIFAHLTARWGDELHRTLGLGAVRGKRVLVLAHTDELVLQAARKMKDVAPDRTVGIVKAERNEVSASVVVASVQSLRSPARLRQLRNIGLIIVDECHHATAPTYRRILEHFGALAPQKDAPADWRPSNVIVAGFTATLARGDKAKLSEVWQDCTFKRGISFGIRRGYLLDVRGRRVIVPDLELNKVKKSGGDYQDSSLADALDASFAPEIVARAYREHAADRKGLCFTPTVAAAEHFAEAFAAEGIPAAVVHGKLGREERRLLLKRLAAGELQVIVNCAVLTEGFDDPTISCVVIARPTRSAPLYQQMVGRGLRPDLSLPVGGRGDCLVLDVVGASRTHDLRSLIDLSEADIREEIDDGDLSLIGMEEEELALLREEDASAALLEEEEMYRGETAAEEFDPLGRAGIGAWLQTEAGYYFLPAGTKESVTYVVIAPSEEPGCWDVATLPADLRAPGSGFTEHRGLSLEMSCSWAEEVMEELGNTLGNRKKTWRSKGASVQQLWKARREGVVIPEEHNLTSGDVSDMIEKAQASRRIDPVIGFLLAAREG
jgi:superfamily II DNA or RNA helicase